MISKSVPVSKIQIVALILAISPFVESIKSVKETIRFVALVHRHGDRYPLRTYPNDPHINHVWPGGRGALSSDGSLQMFTLGRNLRRRYGRLLPSDGVYTSETMHVMSSPVERAQMSSLSMLAGLMPPPSQGNPLPISWQPIPISHMPKRLDLLIAQDAPCPRYDKMLAQLIENPPAELYQDYEGLHQYLSQHSGLNKTVVRLFSTLWDTFLTQYTHNMELPLWAVSVFPDRLRPIVEQGYKLRTHTKFMSLAKAAPLVTRITNQMLAHQNRSSSRLVYIYSGHDLTLLSMMRLLKLENQTATIPEYGATLAFELHCESEDECSRMEFRIAYYFSYDDMTPTELTIPNCFAPCMLERFVKSNRYIFDFDFARECDVHESNAIYSVDNTMIEE